ncbi:tRNA-guanine(34) transglycosylase, partial [Candidatus Gottesmanbacteria bacterium]|nr:tRNA-guanine(34) transglycosylase [Candidatus Gottesmanbacteria bacterium]
HHLFRVRELLAYRLATVHNIHFVNALMESIRQSIATHSFLELKKQWL